MERTAKQFLERLQALRLPAVAKSHSHLASNNDDTVLGVRMGQVFALAKEFMDMRSSPPRPAAVRGGRLHLGLSPVSPATWFG